MAETEAIFRALGLEDPFSQAHAAGESGECGARWGMEATRYATQVLRLLLWL